MTRAKSHGPKLYQGTSEGLVFVTTPNGQRQLDPRFDVRNRSPTGFGWSYCGTGAAQLVLALAADARGHDRRALELYHEFKFRFPASCPRGMPWGSFFADELRLDLTESQSHRIYKFFY